MPSRRSPRLRSWYSASPLRTLRMRFSIRTPVWTRSTSYRSTMVLLYHGTHRAHKLVLLPPERVDPFTERVTARAGLSDRLGEELRRDLQKAHADHDTLHAVGQELPYRH